MDEAQVPGRGSESLLRCAERPTHRRAEAALQCGEVLGKVLAGLSEAPRDLVLCSKGIEAGTGRLMNDVAREACPASAIAVLSGPTFAHEVAAGLPTAVTLACSGGEAQWERLMPAIARPTFRPYYSDDVTGAEIGGAIKNVLAIACGLVDGLGLGQNARAALIARGYAEMLRFGEALGAKPETLAGLCGLGDLVLTCSSTSSHRRSVRPRPRASDRGPPRRTAGVSTAFAIPTATCDVFSAPKPRLGVARCQLKFTRI